MDEEVGMKGAENLDMSVLEGKALINLDSEEEGIFVSDVPVECAIHLNFR